MQMIIFCILSIIISFSLLNCEETKNVSEIISSHHNNSNIGHIHESVDKDEGTGFRIGTEFFIDNNPKRGKRDSEKIIVQKNNRNELLSSHEIINEKSNDENNNISNDFRNNNMNVVNCGRKSITYYFLITMILLLLIVY